MLTTTTTLSLVLSTLIAASAGANSCQSGFTLCSPSGATNSLTPSIGSPDFESLYVDLLHSSLPPPPKRARRSDGAASLCCNALLSCLTMSNLALPFCYDKFTSNFFLPDGSSGALSAGTYTSQAGDTANLVTGDYTFKNGTKGNIYSGNPAAVPNTATLPMPTLYTSSGVGGPVPTSALGAEVTRTYTTTLAGTTVQGTTRPASTVSAAVETETSVVKETLRTTVSGSVEQSTQVVTSMISTTNPATTIPGTTVEGTTVQAAVSTVVTTEVGSPSAGSTSASKNAGATSGSSRLGLMGYFVVVTISVFI